VPQPNPVERLIALAAEAEREKARRHLIHFTLYTKPNYKAGFFHHKLCLLLEKFYADIKVGKQPRVIIQAPRRHGKTELVSVRWPAWVFGRDKDFEFLFAAYGQTLSESNSRKSQNVMRSPQYHDLFPEREMATERTDEWTIKDGAGIYKATSVGGAAPGYGANALVIDDFVKDWTEATSPTIQQRNLDWFRSTAFPCLLPEAGVLIIGTRWSLRDLIGMILDTAKDSEEAWEFWNFPAMAEEADEFRKVGDPLHPERYSLEALHKIRKTVGELIWVTMYQGHPVPTVGKCFFHSEGDEPEDQALKRCEADVKAPQRCKLEIITPGKAHKWEESTAGHWRIWEPALTGFCYGAGCDTAEGIDRGDGVTDEHVIRIWRRGIIDAVIDHLHIMPKVTIGEAHKPCLVASYRSRADTPDLAWNLAEALFYYNHAHISIERTSAGISLIDMYLALIYPTHLILREETIATLADKAGMKLGTRIGPGNKNLMLDRLKEFIRDDKYTNPDREFFEQARHFVNINGALRGETGWHDDVVLAEAHAAYCHFKAPMVWPGNLEKPVKRRRSGYSIEERYSG
jgi:hypothetical protein